VPSCCACKAAQAQLVQQLHALLGAEPSMYLHTDIVCPNQLVNDVCSYERERPERVRTIHVKGSDSASYEERERYLYKPTFKPLWCDQVYESMMLLAACQ